MTSFIMSTINQLCSGPITTWRTTCGGQTMGAARSSTRRMPVATARRRGVGGREGGRVGRGIEGRARLGHGLDDAVVLGIVKVAAADQGADVGGGRVQGEEGAVQVGRVGSFVVAVRAGGLNVVAVGD